MLNLKQEKNWASVYYNLTKHGRLGRQISFGKSIEEKAETPKYVLEEMKKYGDPNREDYIHVIPRR